MGDHYHKKGEWMFSYRFMTMSMEGNLDGTNSLTPDTIATTVPNRFFGIPGQPPTLRVVPTEMTMDMNMFGMMYAPSNRVTLMGMLNFIEKEMEHITYMGPAGTTQLGTFRTKTSGLGDTPIVALIRIDGSDRHKFLATAGLSFPTGSLDEAGTVLAPTGMMPTMRFPYPMQLGSGTYDPIVGFTYSGFGKHIGWGGQWTQIFRLGENDESYTLGDEGHLTGWMSFLAGSKVSLSGRVAIRKRQNIEGIDPSIVAPVQTADPARQGFERVEFGAGINILLGKKENHRLAFEALVPMYQDLQGPQLETDWQAVLGYQFTIY